MTDEFLKERSVKVRLVIVDLVALNLFVVLVVVIVMLVSRIYSNRNCIVKEEFVYLNSLCNSKME